MRSSRNRLHGSWAGTIAIGVTVGCTGSLRAETLHVPSIYPDIQSALDAAQPGDEVVLADGTYTGADNRELAFNGKAITLRSQSGDPARCVIDAEGDYLAGRRVFEFSSNEPAETLVTGVTVRGGYRSTNGVGTLSGGGVVCGAGCTPTFENCIFTGNQANEGGGLFIQGSTLVGCLITGNSAAWGAGGGIAGEGTLIDCVITGNTQFPPDGEYAPGGGGASMSGMLIGCTISNNTTQFGLGGGLASYEGITCIDCTFTDNATTGGLSLGGAVVGVGTFIGCTFSGNSASSLDSDEFFGRGGAAFVVSQSEETSATFYDCVFLDNSAFRGGAIGLWSNWSVILVSCTFSGNVASPPEHAGVGGAISVVDATAEVVGCTFMGNRAESPGNDAAGGAVYVEDGEARLVNCVVTNNLAEGRGGGVYASGGVTTIANSTLAGNFAAVGSGGVQGVGVTSVDIDNSIVWGNLPDQVAPASGTTVRFSDVQGGWAGKGPDNIDDDPLFVQPPTPGGDGDWATADDDPGNVRLQAGSPCIDAGDNDLIPDDAADIDDDGDVNEPVPFDIAGRTRVQGESEPLTVDMGAYEVSVCPADTNGSGTVDVVDLVQVILEWGCQSPPGTCLGDVNGDGVVNVSDLVDVVLHWGPCS